MTDEVHPNESEFADYLRSQGWESDAEGEWNLPGGPGGISLGSAAQTQLGREDIALRTTGIRIMADAILGQTPGAQVVAAGQWKVPGKDAIHPTGQALRAVLDAE